MTISLKATARDATHRYRAINMLSGFTSVFILSALALMGGQGYRALGIEWLIVTVLSTAINTNGYIQAFRLHSSLYALSPFRIIGGSVCYLGQIVGSVLILLGSSIGISVTAIAVIVNFYFLVSGAWLLIVGRFHGSDKAAV
jgi:hypothetical protein